MEELIQDGSVVSMMHYIKHNTGWKDFKNKSGDNFLHLCVKYKKLDLLKYMISMNHPINLQNNEGDTALHMACNDGSTNAVIELLKSNANSDIQNAAGDSALHKAIESKNKEAAKLMISHNCNLNLQNLEGETPLHLSIGLCLQEITEELISSHADLEMEDLNGNRALHLACRSNNSKSLKSLISRRVRLDTANHRAETALSLCLKYGSTECLYIILDTGISIKEEDLKLAREVSKPSVWQHIFSIFKEQNQLSPKSPDDSNSSPTTLDASTNKILKMQETIAELQIEKEKLLQKIEKINSSSGLEEIKGIEVSELIGSGECGEVYKAVWRFTDVAVKKFVSLKEFYDEIEIHKNIRHPNIVLLMAICRNPPMIVTEFMELGSLAAILHSEMVLTEKQLIGMALDVIKGLVFLHSTSPCIVHRDLKSANCLVDRSFRVKIADFGLAKSKDNTLKDIAAFGTFTYMAPEVITEQKYSVKSDMYAFGILLWEIVNRKKPFEEMAPVQIVYQVVHNNKRPSLLNNGVIAQIIQSCWSTDSLLRPSSQQIFQQLHDFYLTFP